MELSSPAERILKELMGGDKKRKLETTVSTDRANLSGDNLKRRDKIIKENTVADISVIRENASMEDASMAEVVEAGKKEMEVEEGTEVKESSEQGAACSEIIKEEKEKVAEKVVEKPKKVVEKPKKVEKEKENSVTDEEKGKAHFWYLIKVINIFLRLFSASERNEGNSNCGEAGI